jgi:hypothetical protein
MTFEDCGSSLFLEPCVWVVVDGGWGREGELNRGITSVYLKTESLSGVVLRTE